jgi:signal transduction histidine kinase
VQLASIASSRLENLIRRISGFVHLVLAIEVSVNGFTQVFQKDGNGSWLLALYLAVSAGTLISLWFGKGKLWPILYALAVYLILALTPFAGFGEYEFSSNGRPWIWWALGFAVILFAVFTKAYQWISFLALVSGTWIVVEIQLFGLSRILQATLDSAYFIVYCFALMALVSLVRQGARGVDEANSEAIQSSLQQARVEAIERERQRVDALVHDQVLHTLLLAARAVTKEDQLAASKSARQAIASLTRAETEETSGKTVTVSGLFKAIQSAALQLDSRVKVETRGSSSETLPPEVAQALTEATLQALDNAIQHSKAELIELLLASEDGKVEVQIVDDGIGFRPERVPKNRIGIGTSIVSRLTSIGGLARISSEPGNGTAVILRWERD